MRLRAHLSQARLRARIPITRHIRVDPDDQPTLGRAHRTAPGPRQRSRRSQPAALRAALTRTPHDHTTPNQLAMTTHPHRATTHPSMLHNTMLHNTMRRSSRRNPSKRRTPQKDCDQESKHSARHTKPIDPSTHHPSQPPQPWTPIRPRRRPAHRRLGGRAWLPALDTSADAHQPPKPAARQAIQARSGGRRAGLPPISEGRAGLSRLS
jgi:hypothetical protein